MTKMTGAEVIIKALNEQGVDHIFGYPGGAVLPLYDELFKSNKAPAHVLVRHEQGAVHAAEGYARSSGKPGVVLVTSGPGATNAVTGLTDALMDSIPLVCISGQVPSHLIGTDAFQECDTVGITRPCTKHNWLVKRPEDLAKTIHLAFLVATTGRPGPVLIDIPKDIQFADAEYCSMSEVEHSSYKPKIKPEISEIEQAIELMSKAKKPVFYTGGGVINSGPEASYLLRELVALTGFPVTSTLMGLGAYPANGDQWLGMLGMHGTYEANMTMHDSDLIINIGARFDDRVTGRLDAFSPNSKKIHVDIDPSSINKTIEVDISVIGDCAHVIENMLILWRSKGYKTDTSKWWDQINKWRDIKSLNKEDFFINWVRNHVSKVGEVALFEKILLAMPRLWLELCIVFSFVGLVFSITFFSDSKDLVVPTLAVFAFAAVFTATASVRFVCFSASVNVLVSRTSSTVFSIITPTYYLLFY